MFIELFQFQYAILLSVVLVLHVSTAISGLMLGVCRSKEIVSDALTAFIHSYDYDPVLRETMDWTQLKVNFFFFNSCPHYCTFHQYHCCGNQGPDDWINYSKSIEVPELLLSTTPDENSTATFSDTSDSDSNAMPISCCIQDSQYKKFQCENYYTNGCFTQVQEIISANVMIASFSALGMALFDVGV